MRRPARWATSLMSPPTGAAKRNRERPNPSGFTSRPVVPESMSMSRPVMPRCRVPSPT